MELMRIAGPQSYYLFHISSIVNGSIQKRAIYLFGDDHEDIITCDTYDIETT